MNSKLIICVFCFNCFIVLGQKTITEIEYFFDTDPGVGNAHNIGFADVATLNETFSIPINSLSSGIHILHMRTKNNTNKWGLYAKQVFYKSPQFGNNEIVLAEYFIDTDPGVGNATAVTLTQGAIIDETLNIAIPNNLSVGDHLLHLRVQSSNGKWSLYARPQFTSTLDIEGVVLKNLKIYPNPAQDVLYFSIQNNTIEQVKLVDINGRVVLKASKNINQLNLSSLPTGFYLLQIKTDLGSISKKIIKK